MAGKNKGGREVRKPKQDKKPKSVETTASPAKGGQVKKTG